MASTMSSGSPGCSVSGCSLTCLARRWVCCVRGAFWGASLMVLTWASPAETPGKTRSSCETPTASFPCVYKVLFPRYYIISQISHHLCLKPSGISLVSHTELQHGSEHGFNPSSINTAAWKLYTGSIVFCSLCALPIKQQAKLQVLWLWWNASLQMLEKCYKIET